MLVSSTWLAAQPQTLYYMCLAKKHSQSSSTRHTSEYHKTFQILAKRKVKQLALYSPNATLDHACSLFAYLLLTLNFTMNPYRQYCLVLTRISQCTERSRLLVSTPMLFISSVCFGEVLFLAYHYTTRTLTIFSITPLPQMPNAPDHLGWRLPNVISANEIFLL